MMQLDLDGGPVSLRRIADLARGPAEIRLSGGVRARLAQARTVVESYLADGSVPVYGLNTGLGGNVKYRLKPEEIQPFQEQMIVGRCIGMGPPLAEPLCRAVLAARIVGLAQGGSGLSPALLDLLIAMLKAGVTPVIPSRGSIGAGDLGLVAHLGAVVIGRGEAWFGGTILPGAAALAAAGLAPATLGAKDGLGLLNASPVTTAHGALTLAALEDLLLQAAATAALSMEGYAANPAIFDARLAAARPAGGQVAATALFRALLADSALQAPNAARAIQDALSFRTLGPIFGVAFAALARAAREIEVELNGAVDNPLVLIDDGVILSTTNFHTPAIALAFDALAIALNHLASAGVQRIQKLMTPHLSGLPKYLSPIGGASNGFNSLQKTASALYGEIRLKAGPASLDAVPVSEIVEDHAPQSLLTISKLAEQMDLFRMLVAIEAMVAAQAADLRGFHPLGAGSGLIHQAVRSIVPALDTDRETGPDAMKVLATLTPALAERLRPLAQPTGCLF
ncbi:MAG: histidine ammonia-lyase [Rhodospirillales bacterium]|nr:histidine ammonia-lyase [Rhodospirillales bacterium]